MLTTAGYDIEQLRQLDVGRVGLDEPMSDHTTLRVGGPADAFVEPDDIAQLQRVIGFAREVEAPLTFIGGGSNLLVTDAGLRGIVVRLGDGFDRIEFDEAHVTGGGAASLTRLVRECARGGWAGLECAIGIPGSVGGAIFGNAGANGGEVGATAALIRCVNADGEIRDYTNDEAGFSYRHSELRGNVVVAGTFPLRRDDANELNRKLKDLLARRKATQPVDRLNAGCIFKNTPLGPAGKLIDEMGGKGLRLGAARVSELHANFIINEGGALASDVLGLIAMVRLRFRETYGMEVEPEIRTIGEGTPMW